MPTITVDKCDATTLILNRESLDCEIVSAKSSALNIQMPGKTDEGGSAEGGSLLGAFSEPSQ